MFFYTIFDKLSFNIKPHYYYDENIINDDINISLVVVTKVSFIFIFLFSKKKRVKAKKREIKVKNNICITKYRNFFKFLFI
jgi:hypothetical protein